MNVFSNKGITLIALIVTVIIMVIIAGISINYGTDLIEKSESNKLQAEALIVQQAVRKQYLKYDTSRNMELLVGEATSASDEANLLDIDLIGGTYYLLNTNDLKKIGVDNAKDIYIVNYQTGEVINKTQVDNGNYNKMQVFIEGIEY